MELAALTSIADAAGAVVAVDQVPDGNPDAPLALILRAPLATAVQDELLAQAANGRRIVVSSTSAEALAALDVTTTPAPPHPSSDPLVADPVTKVHGTGLADGLELTVAEPLGLRTDDPWAMTDEGIACAGSVRVGQVRIGALAGRWVDAAADDDGARFWSRVLSGAADADVEAAALQVLDRPGPEVEHPPVPVVDADGWEPREVPVAEINSPEFLRAVAHAGRTLPAAVYDALVDFADESPAAGAMLIEHMPVGDLPPTPEHPLLGHDAKTDRVSEFALLTVGRVLGRPVGYKPEHGGDVVQNISPTKQNQEAQVSTSSKSMLEFHTEAAFHPHRPRYLMLLALRGDPNAATTLCSVRAVVDTLSPRSRSVLFQPRFTTGIDESYAGGRSTSRSLPRPILYGDHDKPKLWLDADLMEGTDPVAQGALDEVARLVREHASSVTLKAGDLLVVDNDVAVHGRSPFKPRFDGTDRWLQRSMVISDHTAADGSRDGRVITTRFIA